MVFKGTRLPSPFLCRPLVLYLQKIQIGPETHVVVDNPHFPLCGIDRRLAFNPQAILPSLKAKCPGKPRAGAVVAAGEAGRRPVVPVAVERYIPLQIAEELHVLGRVGIEMNPAGLGDGR